MSAAISMSFCSHKHTGALQVTHDKQPRSAAKAAGLLGALLSKVPRAAH